MQDITNITERITHHCSDRGYPHDLSTYDNTLTILFPEAELHVEYNGTAYQGYFRDQYGDYLIPDSNPVNVIKQYIDEHMLNDG